MMRGLLYNPQPDHPRVRSVVRMVEILNPNDVLSFWVESQHESRVEATNALLAAEARDRPVLVS